MASEEPSSVPLENLPANWNDRRLLNFPPFGTMFSERQVARTRRHEESNWASLIKDNMKDMEFCKAYIRWCLMVFKPSSDAIAARNPGAGFFATQWWCWELFVDVFYRLFLREKEDAVHAIVNKARKNSGLATFLLAPVSKQKIQVGAPASSFDGHVNVDDSITSSEEVLALINSTSEIFMKTASPYNGGTNARIQARCGIEPLSRNDAASTGSIDQEFATESNPDDQKNQKRRWRNRGCGKRNRQTSQPPYQKRAVFSTSVKHIVAVDTTDSGMKRQCPDLEYVSEQIIICNERKPTGSTYESSTVKSASAFQERRDSRTTKEWNSRHLPDQTSAIEMPLAKKRKLPAPVEGQEFVKRDSSSLHTVHSVPNRRKKNKVMQDVSAFEVPASSSVSNLGYVLSSGNMHHRRNRSNARNAGPCSVRPSSTPAGSSKASCQTYTSDTHPLSISRPSSTDSDKTLVNHAGNETSRRIVCKELSEYVENAEHNGFKHLDRREYVVAPRKKIRPDPSFSKPSLPSGTRPRIWAGSRQALCETTSWFRCYHGGVYFNAGKAYGYLLGGYSSQRDVFRHDGRLIISHGGGKALDGCNGQRANDVSVRALLNNYRKGFPLVLVADNKYALFPFDLAEKMYVALGLYWIVAAWAEKDVSEFEGKSDIRIKYKFAFQYCEGQGPPWWISSPSNVPNKIMDVLPSMDDSGSIQTFSDTSAQDSSFLSPRNDNIFPQDADGGLTTMNCRLCGLSSTQIYRQGWTCLHPNCEEFFLMNANDSLEYEDQFLKLRSRPNFGNFELNVPSPMVPLNASADSVYSTRGWMCPECGQLCPRERWECWACPLCNIKFTGVASLPIRSHKEFWPQAMDLKDYMVYKTYKASDITVSTGRWGPTDDNHRGLHYIFELPNDRGRIHLISGNVLVNGRADELFKHYQEDARDKEFLRRYPLRFHHARGRMLTNYFSHNAGMPYEYAVTTNITDPFDRAPESVNKALQLIRDRVASVVHIDDDFNEILTAAYMAEQKMSYHTDDERGLGPVVASLSLGSIASMHFRQRRTPGHSYPEKRLTVILRHGDVLCMEGAEIQKSYEHSVVPLNFRIAATARYIDPNP